MQGSGVVSDNRIVDNLLHADSPTHASIGIAGSTGTWQGDLAPGPNVVGGAHRGGNAWAGPGGFSLSCADADADDICDAPLAIAAGHVDARPLVAAAQATVDTPAGTGVGVQVATSNTGVARVTVAFAEVVQAGVTTLATSLLGPDPPGLVRGSPSIAYELTTSALFSGPVSVCIAHGNAAFADEAAVRLFQREDGVWRDRSASADPANRVVCAEVEGLSLFAVFNLNTPRGLHVTVSPAPGATMTFARVLTSGQTTVTTSAGGPAPPAGFALGDPPTYYELTTTAVSPARSPSASTTAP